MQFDDEEYGTLKKALSKISLNEPEAHEPDMKKRARSLSQLASLARLEIQQADQKVEIAEKKSQDLVNAIEKEIKRSVQEKHNRLVIATKEMLEKGAGDGREGQVHLAVEEVADLMELSVSLIPSSRDGKVMIGGNPWKGEEEVSRPEAEESLLAQMTSVQDKKNDKEKEKRKKSEVEGGKSFRRPVEVEEDGSVALEKKKFASIVKNIVQDFEFQLVEAKAPKGIKTPFFTKQTNQRKQKRNENKKRIENGNNKTNFLIIFSQESGQSRHALAQRGGH